MAQRRNKLLSCPMTPSLASTGLIQIERQVPCPGSQPGGASCVPHRDQYFLHWHPAVSGYFYMTQSQAVLRVALERWFAKAVSQNIYEKGQANKSRDF